MWEIKITIISMMVGSISLFLFFRKRIKKVTKRIGESRTRTVDAKEVAEEKRKTILLMERGRGVERRKGKYLKGCLENLELWEEEEVKYRVCIRGMGREHSGREIYGKFPWKMKLDEHYWWYQLATNDLCPIYYSSGNLIFVDEDGIIRELDTCFLKTQYSKTAKDLVQIDVAFTSLILPCEEKSLFN